MGRFLNADAFVSTGQGILGNNMFIYCLNNPVNFVDRSGNYIEAVEWWTSTMWWLCGADAVSLVGDIVYGAGILILGVYALIVADEITTPQISFEEEKEKTEPEPPDITYPGDDPSKAPGDDYEWHGKQPVGGDKGAWVNENTGEQWHPDLNHKPPKGPHWDYTDILGEVWTVFKDGRIISWK